MGKFFQSELVRGTIQEMTVLQEFCFKSAMNLPLLKKEQQLEYFDALIQLIEKQKIFYTRVRLSDDPDAESIKENMKQAALLLIEIMLKSLTKVLRCAINIDVGLAT